ncbi:MAG: UDP-N-acetylmuramoyl-L-alanyl-D-glutamate--2,6-diaminopimelate ligase [Defluviitaleaceae bacterium]|nr:UDP-N-acetylmuramoyl-L-alanyl-D-glutamate--2,6-diaminopimelate ligase [Defluviitaleaceae bacterium]
MKFRGIAIDSRKVKAGYLYVCIEGLQVDGHSFAAQAVENGAIALLCKKGRGGDMPDAEVLIIEAEDTRLEMAKICKQHYEDPSKDMKLIGITGTNGKTSTAGFVEQALVQLGQPVGSIGTLGVRVNGEALDMPFATSTTPDTVELYEILTEMKARGVAYVVMEVSSHALALHKVAQLTFDVGVFTNLSQDHLDFHGTMENYRLAKAGLFNLSRKGIINHDDDTLDFLLDYTKGKCDIATYGINGGDFKASNHLLQKDGISYIIEGQAVDSPPVIPNQVGDDEVEVEDDEGQADALACHCGLDRGSPTHAEQSPTNPITINIPIAGKFTIYNSLATFATLATLGFDKEAIATTLANIKGIGGRIQSIPTGGKGFSVIVDYAHTPDGLENIISSCREFTEGRIITIFGCGGDRDPIKRPIMGEVAGRLSDYCIITSDNSRNEDPAAIIAQVEEGLAPTKCEYEMIIDRKEAIYKAIAIAKPDDCIIIAGKGHEDYQEFEKGRQINFDDKKIAEEALNQTQL